MWFKWSVKKHCVAKVLLAIWETFLHENNRNYNSYKFSYKFSLASRVLLQSLTEFNRLLLRNFCTCYSHSYHNSMVKTTSIFWSSKLRQIKYVKTMLSFRPSKLHERKYVKTTSIFHPSKLRWRKYVEKTSQCVDIFSSTYRCVIAIESTLIQRGVSIGEFLHQWFTNIFTKNLKNDVTAASYIPKPTNSKITTKNNCWNI